MIKHIIFIGIIGLFSTSTLAQSIVKYSSYWDNYLVRNYTTDDGFPSEQVTFSYQDSLGFMWVLSSSGLMRYDGLSLKAFNKGRLGGFMYELQEDSNGDIWIPATSSGVYKFDGDTLFNYLEPLNSPNGVAKSMVITDGDTMYIGIYGESFVVFDGDSLIKKYTTEHGLVGNKIWKVISDRNGKIWIGTDEGLSIFYNGKFTNFTTDNGLPYNTIRGLTEMYNGDIWVGTDKEGIVVFRNEKPYKYYHTKDGLNGTYPQYFAQNPTDSSIWVGDHGSGLYRFKHGTFENFNETDGLISNYVMYIGFSSDGMAYIGTEHGLSILKKRKIQIIDERIEGIGNFPFITVIEDNENRVWLGSEGRGFYYHENEHWKSLENPPNYTNGYSSGAAIDNNGNAWFATQGSGIIKVDNTNNVGLHLNTEDGLFDEFINGLEFDTHNNLWVCTNSGINVLDSTNTIIDGYSASNGMTNEFCVNSLYDSEGNFWAGTYGGGLYRIKDQQIEHFDTTRGISDMSIFSIFEHSSGKILIGSGTGGVSIFNGFDFDFYGPETGMPSNSVYGFSEDKNNDLWISSSYGLYFVPYNRLTNLIEGTTTFLNHTRFSVEDGLPTQSMEPLTNSTSHQIHTGEILFATSKGVAVVSPETAQISSTNFFPYIDAFSVNNISKKVAQPLVLSSKETKIEIVFSALNLESPNKTKFRVHLLGVDDDWVFVNNRTTAYYDYLPDGDYTFTVSAIGPDGMWSDKTASINFTVLPPFYKTWWFRLSLILGFAGFVAGSVQWRNSARLKKLNRELAYQHKIQQERERISRDLHDNVGSQITNLITGIEISNLHIKNSNREKAAEILHMLDSEARNTMTDLRETIWLLDKEEVPFSAFIDHLKGYLNRQKQFLGTMQASVSSQIEQELVLNPTQSLNVMRIIQEALNNARKYAAASTFHLHFMKKNGGLILEISDNGKGMNVNESAKIGNGLGNMKERAELISAEIIIESGPGIGTLIKLELPNLP